MYKAMEALVESSHMANPVATAPGSSMTTTAAAAATAPPPSSSAVNPAASPGSPSSPSSPTSPGTTPAPPSSTLTATTTASLATTSLANGSLGANNNGKLGHERRHSDGTAGKGGDAAPSANGGIKMSLVGVSATATVENETSSGSTSRRNSLPPSYSDLTSLGPLEAGRVDLKPEAPAAPPPAKTNGVVINMEDEDEEFDEDDERNSETARLTATV